MAKATRQGKQYVGRIGIHLIQLDETIERLAVPSLAVQQVSLFEALLCGAGIHG